LAKGRIIGSREAGVERRDITKRVKKKDGKKPSLNTVFFLLAFLWKTLEDVGRHPGRCAPLPREVLEDVDPLRKGKFYMIPK
jgi:hypothetical protein